MFTLEVGGLSHMACLAVFTDQGGFVLFQVEKKSYLVSEKASNTPLQVPHALHPMDLSRVPKCPGGMGTCRLMGSPRTQELQSCLGEKILAKAPSPRSVREVGVALSQEPPVHCVQSQKPRGQLRG